MLSRVNRESIFSFYPNHFECDKASIVFGLPFGPVFVLLFVPIYLWAADDATMRSGSPLFRDSRSVAAFKGSRAGFRGRAIRAVRVTRICFPLLLSGSEGEQKEKEAGSRRIQNRPLVGVPLSAVSLLPEATTVQGCASNL